MKKRHRDLRKAAILIASLDAENAATLMRQMSPGQAHLLQQELERLEEIDPREQNEVLEEFFRIGPLLPVKEPSGIELNGRLPKYLSMSSHPETEDRTESWSSNDSPPFQFLQDAPVHSLAPLLEREHPQTIAVVASYLPTDRAAELLAALPSELQAEVARRLVDLDETDPEVLREVERGLESWLSEQSRGSRRRSAGLTTLTNILGAADPSAKQHILTNLARHDRQLAGKLRVAPRSELTFAELEHLDAASLSVVVRHATQELLVLALAGARPEFAERVSSLFSKEKAHALNTALRNLGPTRLSDVEEAQTELVVLAQQLELQGEITLKSPSHLSVAV